MAGFKFSVRIAAVALLVSGFAASCSQIMGDIDVIGVGDEPQVDIREAEPKPKICEEGVTQCMGRLLQLCTDEGTAWATLEVCATPALCESSGISTVSDCIDPVCLVEEMSCSKEGVLRLCNLDQNGWQELETCETPGHCNAANRQCLPSPCEPGERRCNSGALERCQDDQKDWLSLDTCETNLLCEATLEAAELLASTGAITGAAQGEVAPEGAVNAVLDVSECLNPACLPGEVKCDGSRLERCNEGRTAFELSEECATTVLCQATLTYVGLGGRPRCRQPICVSGEHSCTETGVLQVCTEGRDSYVTTEACIGPEFCNAPAADVPGGQGCLDAPCESGEMQCNGAQVQVCRTNRTGFDALIPPCETRGLCNDDDNRRAFCEPAVCQRGPLSSTEFLCQGTALLRCNDQHTAYEPFAQCATPELCQAGFGFDGCRPPVCSDNTFQCNGDFLARCNPSRTAFENIERCAPGECNASAGRCADPCLEGTARCNAQGQLEECRNRLVGREITARCLSQQLCDPIARSCKQPVCTADGQRRCRVSGQNSILEVCTAGRSTFTALDTCGPGEFCDVNNDRCDVCDQNSTPTCEGSTLVTCAANGQTETPQSCPQGCQTQTGADRCRTCAIGSASCDGTQLVVCQAGAAGEIFVREPCASGALCQQTLGNCNSGLNGQACQCTPAACLPNAVGCQGRQPVRCNADRTAFVANGGFCTNTLCDPDTGSCDLCNVGDTQCAANGTMEGCSIDGSRFETILRAGNARCLSPNGPEQRCAGGGTPSTTACTNGICLDGVGCVECDANNFDSECVQTPAGPARTECVGGDESSVPCQNQSGACFVASCNEANGCNTQPRCTGALPFCVANGSCVQCIADGDCGAGLICSANRCAPRCQANVCNNGQLQVCQANGRLAAPTTCAVPNACTDPACGSATTCSTASACAPGQTCGANGECFNACTSDVCAGGQLRTCDRSTGLLSNPITCGDIDDCTPGQCAGNACRQTSACTGGQTCGENGCFTPCTSDVCVNGAFQTCDVRTGLLSAKTTCGPIDECTPGQCAGNACRQTSQCVRGQQCGGGVCFTPCVADVCNSGLFQTCNRQTGLLSAPVPCRAVDACTPGECAGNACRQTSECDPGETCGANGCFAACTGDVCTNGQFQSCNQVTGQLSAPTACGAVDACTPGQCLGNACRQTTECSNGEACGPDGECFAACTGDVCAGGQLRSCNVGSGQLSAPSTCPAPDACTPPSCSGATCSTASACLAGALTCNPDTGQCLLPLIGL